MVTIYTQVKDQGQWSLNSKVIVETDGQTNGGSRLHYLCANAVGKITYFTL